MDPLNGTPTSKDGEFDESQIPDYIKDKLVKEAREGYLPKDRYDSSVGKLKDELNNLKELVQSNTAPKPKERIYTRRELKNAVDEMQISEEDADAIWERQVYNQAREEARKETAQTLNSQNAMDKLNQYGDLVEGLRDPDSNNFKRADEAFGELKAALGKDNLTPQEVKNLEVAACAAVFGPLDKLKNRVKDLSNRERQSVHEVGNGYSENESTSDKTTKGIPKAFQEYYAPLVARGTYKNWDEVREELKYASPSVKRKHGLS